MCGIIGYIGFNNNNPIEKKILNINSLYYKAKKRLKIPRKGLKIIIQLLLNNKILVDRSRHIKKTVLSNYIRKRIYNFLQNNLGTHFSLLKRYFSSKDKLKSPGELIWHLDMLIRFNYIKKIKFLQIINIIYVRLLVGGWTVSEPLV